MRTSKNRIDTIAAALEQSTLLVIRVADRRELSLTASDVLHRLDTDGPARLSALVAATALSQPSMTQLVQRFERRGLVSRTVDPSDRRAVVICITDSGREIVQQRRRGVRERLSELLSALNPDEQAALELAAQVTLLFVTRLNSAEPVEEVAAPSVSGLADPFVSHVNS